MRLHRSIQLDRLVAFLALAAVLTAVLADLHHPAPRRAVTVQPIVSTRQVPAHGPVANPDGVALGAADAAIAFQRYHDAQVAKVMLAVAAAEARSRRDFSFARSPAYSAPRVTGGASAAAPVNATGSINGMACGGNLPSCCTLQHESNGDPTAVNESSGAAGLWQFIPSTWNGYGGYASAAQAPVSVQNQKAIELFAGGAGAHAWYGDGCYNGR